jgi:hypothetical protein
MVLEEVEEECRVDLNFLKQAVEFIIQRPLMYNLVAMVKC